ncbi:MAG TPA: monofunctional biosynthetic peptidoglycan transglycosylase [bacterium]
MTPPDEAVPRPGASRTPLRRHVFRAALLLAAALLLYEGSFFARILWWRTHAPGTTAFMRARLAELRRRDPSAALDQTWVPYGRISLQLKRAVVAAEDAKFLSHEGFDWEEIGKARERNEARGRVVRGASTITQQLAKNLFLSGRRSWARKGQEALIALMLEAALDKRRILELYLNVIEWGERTYGAEAAARRYFGAGAAELTAEQAARLAAMIPNPRFYERRGVTGYLARRSDVIRARMEQVRAP